MENTILLSKPECISLRSKPTLYIGSLFKSDIYYSYKDIIADRHAVLYFEGDDLMYLEYTSKDRDEGSARLFEYESEIRIEGLVLYNLGSYLLVTALYGDLRIARRREYAPY